MVIDAMLKKFEEAISEIGGHRQKPAQNKTFMNI